MDAAQGGLIRTPASHVALGQSASNGISKYMNARFGDFALLICSDFSKFDSTYQTWLLDVTCVNFGHYVSCSLGQRRIFQRAFLRFLDSPCISLYFLSRRPWSGVPMTMMAA